MDKFKKTRQYIKLAFPIYTKEITFVILSVFMLLMFRFLTQNHPSVITSLDRPSYIQGDETYTIYYDYDELDIQHQPLQLNLESEGMTETEVKDYLELVKIRLQKDFSVYADNFNRITGPLDFGDKLYGCNITYQFSPAKYFQNGWIDYEKMDEPIIIHYKAEFKNQYIEDQLTVEINKKSFTNEYKKDFIEYKIEAEAKAFNERQQSSTFDLPEVITFYDTTPKQSLVQTIFMLISVVGFCSILSYSEKKLNQQKEKKNRLIQLTSFINSFSLLYRTGMTLQKCFTLTLSNRLQVLNEDEGVYLELSSIQQMIQNEMRFRDILGAFNDVFNSRDSRRFIRLVLQNLKQGDEYLTKQLDIMAEILWDDRIRRARKESEKASSKLVFPMLLIFILILVMSIVPTFLEVKSIF